ncbi:MAG: coproporphyrinogen III oxidase family protein [Verrucomicrobiae bacterium]|nr:coproporphyrinogen III oxidase family protein [Verrucomicrobiae bacterium]MCP5524536.1 coproporphyrinogen III oxidase family protein [Verrucomicrobiales bacterium]
MQVGNPKPKPSVVPPLQTQTTVGNYFVTNYPPYAFWKPDFVPELEAALERPPRPDTSLGVYVHIPFCRKRCHFCYYKVYTDKDSAQVRAYLDAVLRELGHYASKPFIGGRTPRFVYFGGGTPSYLSEKQLRHLTDEMKRLLSWEAAEEITFEAEPGTLTDHKLAAIRDIGVTRLSLGIEHFDDHILEINGRAHRSKEIDRAYAFARAIGFPQINIDLIAGMVEETEERWRETVAKAVALAPDSVTIYQMEVPYNTTIYQRMKAEGRLVAPVADWDTKRAWVDHAFREFERAGYAVNSTSTVVKDPAKTKFVYRHQLFAGADLASVGVASFGHIHGVHYQNHHEFDPYLAALDAGRSPVYRALTPTPDELYIREFMLLLKLGQVSREYFRSKFGTDPVEQFAGPLEALKATGHLTVEGDAIRLDRAGLLKVDLLIRAFFKPEHQGTKYA